MDKDFYNEASAKKLGWEPEWFGVSTFDDRLVKAVRKWQKDNGLKPDGMVGPVTFRRIWTQRESNIDDYIKPARHSNGQSYIVHNSKAIPIDWPHVILWSDDVGLSMKEGSYTSFAGHEDRKPTFFVTHWDVCLSSFSCAKVLNKRGISIHFMIDNDGTIYQSLDTQHAAWHAGSRKWNNSSIGVEMTNAYYPKYQKTYVSRGHGKRPLIEDAWVHGTPQPPFLGFYDVQLEALKALYKAIHKGLSVPLETPLNKNGGTLLGVSKQAASGRYKGFISHYHLTKRKIDCAGLDIQKILEDIKNER